uniref:uncharacterized protein dbf4b n=1 Tax=Scatophagus argus TaxID=75038 RepID=UPI001ED85FE2|nr:uncharacterized protein dbf4b [Scatophagus argus]
MQQQQYAEEKRLLGSLCPGQKKLEGKTFYLDSVKKRSTALLLETISLLGGGIESFLHKDVNFVVTGSQEYLKDQKFTDSKAGAKGTTEEAKRPMMTRESVLSNDKRRPGTPRPMACGSRGKALLEKAIRNNEQLKKNSVLANARSWGVKILYVDDVLSYLKQLTRETFSAIHKRPERTSTKQQGSPVVKAAALKSPYLKIEDLSRKYKPLHMQSITFPTLWYSGRFSPFESPPPAQFEKRTEQRENKSREKKKVESSVQDKSQTALSCNPSPWRPRKKDLSYCECCQQSFTNLEEHLQSDQHRAFVMDLSNYSMVDQLVDEMIPGFNPNPPQQSDETLNRPRTPVPLQDVCELEPLTDLETEHAVQALQRRGSSVNAHISSPTRRPLVSGPGSPSPGVQFPVPDSATPPADIQAFTNDTDRHPHSPSPVMPALDAEPQAHDLASQQPDTPCLSPCPDPHSLPPVLSPQVPYTSYVMEPHSPYSEPPVLSPHRYTGEDAVEGHPCEMDTAESVFLFVPATAPLLHNVALTTADGVKGTNQESPFGFSELLYYRNDLECATLFSRRSRSLPRQSAMALNPRKRCRSASPERSQSKRRRITDKFSYSGRWTEQRGNECQIIHSRPHPKISSTLTLETLGLKQTFTMFCVPTVQNFTRAPSQMDSFSHGTISAASHPTAANFDPSLQFPKDKPCSAFSSQDSQRSLSQSTSVCIESALIPDLAMLSPSSSDSDWDCDLLSRLGQPPAAPLSPTEQNCELDTELLHRPCTWMHDSSYESRLHTVLQPSAPGTSLCGEEMDPSAFSRTVVQVVEVQH